MRLDIGKVDRQLLPLGLDEPHDQVGGGPGGRPVPPGSEIRVPVAAATSPAPSRSSRPVACGRSRSGSFVRKPSARTSAIGALMKRTQRQPGPAVSNPPSRTPSAAPPPPSADQMPSARFRSSPSKIVTTSESAAGDRIAAASPWVMRPPRSTGPEVASPATTDAPPNRRRLASTRRRAPNRSAARPPRRSGRCTSVVRFPCGWLVISADLRAVVPGPHARRGQGRWHHPKVGTGGDLQAAGRA
jgi:hypothetical protein